MPTEAELQLNAEGTGKKVATVSVDRPVAVDASGNDGGTETVHQQVVALADGRGDLADEAFEAQALGLLREIRDSLAAIQIATSN
jgi:hypothetical protein